MIDAAIVFAAYLAGSIVSSVLVCSAMNLPDPRRAGSGNPGATNVLRIGGVIPAGLTLAGDVLKGVLSVLLAQYLALSPTTQALVVFAVFLGHLYPLSLRFRGGKGIATAFGAITMLAWPIGCVMGALWLTTAAITRYSSCSSMIAIIGAPVAAWWFVSDLGTTVILALMAVFVLGRHRENIRRLIKGTETRIGKRAT